MPVDHWHDVVGDPTFGDAILDRLLNNAHRITLKGGSMRRLYDSTKSDSTPSLQPSAHHTQRHYGPPLLQGDRHGPKSAIRFAESMVGIAGMGMRLQSHANV